MPDSPRSNDLPTLTTGTNETPAPAPDFHRLAEALPQLVWIADAAGACVYVNSRWLEYTDTTLASNLGLGWLDAVHPDDRERVTEAVAGATTRRMPFSVDYRLRRVDGTWRWCLGRGSPALDASGGVERWYGTTTDVDDLRRQEQETLSGKAKLATALWSISDAVCILDAAGNLEECNVSFRAFYRFGPDEFGTRTLREFLGYVDAYTLDGRLLTPEQRPPVRALRGESGQDCELVLRRRDTGESWIAAFNYAPIRDADGTIVGAVLAGRDITERRRLEQELQRSEQRWRFALDGGAQGVWDWDIRNGVTYRSASYNAMLGLEGECTVPGDEFFREVHPDDLERVQACHARHLDGDDPKFGVDFRLRRQDGSYVWIESRGTVVERDDAGQPTRMIGTHQDVSPRKEAEATLADFSAQLVARVQERTAELEAARARLADSESYLRTIFEHAPIGISTTRVSDGSLVEVNPAFARIVGRSPEELLETTWDALTHPDDLAEGYALGQAITAGQIAQFQTLKRYVRPDGEVVYAQLSVSRLGKDPAGELHDIGMVVDVTEAQLADAARRESAQRLDLAMRSARLGVWSSDLREHTVFLDARCRDIRAIPHDLEPEALAAAWSAAVHPDDRARVTAYLAAAQPGTQAEEFTVRVMLPDGRVRHVQSVLALEFAPDGAMRRIVGVDRDVTAEQELVERLRVTIEELDTSNRELEEHRRGLEVAVQARTADLLQAQRIAQMGSWRWLPAGDRLEASRQVYRMFGRDAFPPFLEMRDVVFVADVWERLHRDLADTLRTGSSYLGDVEATRADGTRFWIRLRAEVEQGRDGGAAGLRGTVQDVSVERRRHEELSALNAELTRLNDSLWSAKQAAEEANRAKTAFLSAVSHELRTPLNAVIGFSALLLSGAAGGLNEEQRRQLQHIKRAGEEQLRLVSELLDVTQFEAGRLPIDAEVIALAELLEPLVEECRAAAGARGLEVQPLQCPPALCVVADPVRLRQVVSHLLSNALKFTDQGQVQLAVQHGDGEARIVVEDTGIGIAPTHVAQLFEPFGQVHRRRGRTYAGAGMGLAVCRQLVEAMGGRIGVDSTPGAGSRFWFTLPMAATAATRAVAEQATTLDASA
ncbi:MAG TPA: PAS domain-containing protein [Steroidobacteraceae bacterium]|nr:PAS domain-containing protein [Steroidobacteraceae bacterium]